MKGRESFDQPCIVLDIDGTLCPTRPEGIAYADLEPLWSMVERVREYHAHGYYIILMTGRQMRTYEGNVGLMNAYTLPVLTEWLRRHRIPFDEIYIGRPWPGKQGFYVVDRTISPWMFLSLTHRQIEGILDTQRRIYERLQR